MKRIFTKTSLLLVWLHTVDLKGIIPERTVCPEGYMLWPADLTCYAPFSQGPCMRNQRFMIDQKEPYCQDIQMSWSLNGLISMDNIRPHQTQPEIEEEGWSLPLDIYNLSEEEMDCLEKGKVYWPGDGQCHNLLAAGPCDSGEWLVLEDNEDAWGDITTTVVCKERRCPCDPAKQDLCEVEIKDGDCPCKVALAAEQDGICETGEQLLVNPYGYGVCGCKNSPIHAVYSPDGRCYPLYTRGPCDVDYYLTINNFNEATCTPSLCLKENFVVWEDGECYELGRQGPCGNDKFLTIGESFKPECLDIPNPYKRHFHMLPSGYIKKGPVSVKLQARNCDLDNRGRCRNSFRSETSYLLKKSSSNSYIRRRSSTQYLKWLKQFRNS